MNIRRSNINCNIFVPVIRLSINFLLLILVKNKIDLTEMYCEDGKWVELAQDRD